ncbi:MAG: hypothetical protein HOO89_05450 [Ferruginibacter sp.]|nr:hypothetical protein [Ferruginibacter sp.]
MKQLIILLTILISTTAYAQNVGIGETTPTDTKLQIKRSDSALLLLHNSSFGADVKTGLFFKSGSTYSGSIITTGSTLAQTFRLGISTFGAPSPSGLIERISILDGGNVGIGNTNPLAKLDINGQVKITGGAPGVGKLLESDASGLATWSDKSASFLPTGASGNTLRHNGIGWAANNTLYNNGINIGIGNTNPTTAGLVVDKVVGNTNAIFGSNTSGVSVQTSWPGIGFNTYYSSGSIMIATGGAGYIGADPTTGRLILANTSANATAGAYNALQDKMWIANDGTVSLGSSNLNAENTTLGAGYKLKVYGKVLSEEVRVQLKTAWPDYVFDKNYKKLTINELEKYVDLHKHLPNIPSAKEIEIDGQHLGEIQRKMIEKIEELSLYVIELKKEIDILKEKTKK